MAYVAVAFPLLSVPQPPTFAFVVSSWITGHGGSTVPAGAATVNLSGLTSAEVVLKENLYDTPVAPPAVVDNVTAETFVSDEARAEPAPIAACSPTMTTNVATSRATTRRRPALRCCCLRPIQCSRSQTRGRRSNASGVPVYARLH